MIGPCWRAGQMAQAIECGKCSGRMAEGFVVDFTYGGAAASSWVEGAPERSAWSALKLSGKPKSRIAAWRCERCGFLEHYAVDKPGTGPEAAQRKQAMTILAICLGVVMLFLGVVVLLQP